MERNVYIENNDYKTAISNYLAEFLPIDGEVINVLDSVGRITKEAVFAKKCDPTYNASAMDGIAVNSEKTITASETTPIFLTENQDFIYVNTGNSVPQQYDSVIMIEDVLVETKERISIISPSRPWQHIRVIGESVVASEMVIPSGHKIRPIDLGVVLASGNAVVTVYKKPKVAIIPTGDEMVEDPLLLSEGKLMESNTRVFFELTKEYGGEPHRYDIVCDNPILLEEKIKDGVKNNDVVIINAGSSAGTKDFTAQIIAKLGRVITHGLAIKPGKPTILGIIDGKPVIGVPGYPVSAYIVYDKVVKAVVAKLLNIDTEDRGITVKAELTKRVTASFKNEEYIRVAMGEVEERLVASPLERGAAAVMSMVKADGIMTVPRFTEGIERGETVDVKLYKDLAEIKKYLVIIGSHDPIIDLISDRMPVSSAHVGSMGGIIALQNKAAHLAPIHLLDENGEYNVSYVKKYFPLGTMALIRGLGRTQGILTPKGNPNKIYTVEDIKNGKYNFANRQNGAGTRLLFDDLLRKNNINREEIKGYEKEFNTHLAVATAVKSGGFDCGLAVLSAANIMGLDFVPVGKEHYDFLVKKTMLGDKRFLRFLEIITSKEFANDVEKLGGYTLDGIGGIEVID